MRSVGSNFRHFCGEFTSKFLKQRQKYGSDEKYRKLCALVIAQEHNICLITDRRCGPATECGVDENEKALAAVAVVFMSVTILAL